MGSRRPFSNQDLIRRYGSFDEYRDRFAAAAESLVRDRLLLDPEAEQLIRSAADRWSAAT
jgi:hypothetical protein